MWRSLWRSIDRFSSQHFKQVISELRRIKVVDISNRELVIDLLQSIVEIVTYGDKQDPLIFELFMEYQVLAEFVRMLKSSKNARIEAPLLQYLSIMIQNMENEQAIYYCLSNDYVNNIILHDYKFGVGDLASYFISFLRAVSSKLNKDTLCLLVKVHEDAIVSFPLYNEALKFARHGEKMIQTAVRALTFNIYNVNDDMVYNYVTSPPASKYFSDLVQSLMEQCIRLDGLVHSTEEINPIRGLDGVHQEADKIVDDLYYFNDILSVGDFRLRRTITHDLLHLLLFPIMLPLLEPNENKGSTVSQITSFYIISRLVEVVGGRDIVDPVTKCALQLGMSSPVLYGNARMNTELLESSLFRNGVVDRINGLDSPAKLSEYSLCNYCSAGALVDDNDMFIRNKVISPVDFDDPCLLLGFLFLLFTVTENEESHVLYEITIGKCLPGIASALMKIIAKDPPVSVLTTWHVGWFLQKVLSSHESSCSLDLQSFTISYNRSLSAFEKELEDCWFDYVLDTLKVELKNCKTALETPLESKDAVFLLDLCHSPPPSCNATPDDIGWERMVKAVKAFALHVHLKSLFSKEELPEIEFPESAPAAQRTTHASDLSSATFGSEISLGTGTPCRIALANAGIRDIYMVPRSSSLPGKLLLAEKHPLRANRGVVFAIAPLAGLNPTADNDHPSWLRLTIREFDPKRNASTGRGHSSHASASNQRADGRWILGFSDGKACEDARLLILEEISKQRCHVRSLLSPLLRRPPSGEDQ